MIKFVIGHWTGGNYKPCQLDKDSYQLLIDFEGKQYVGKPVGQASSIGGMNSITYNIACCGGLDRTPLLPTQIEAFYKVCAVIIKANNLTVDKFYTHAEIGEMVKDGSINRLLPFNKYLNQNIGKVDLTNIPCLKGTPKETGDFIRHKIKWYLSKI